MPSSTVRTRIRRLVKRTKLYERDPASSDDYVWLKEGESQSVSFALFEWYEVPGPGDYELQVFYQADEPLAPKLEGLVEGVHASERVGFTVTQCVRTRNVHPGREADSWAVSGH